MSFAAITRRATDRVLSHAGDDAVLRGGTACRVILERGVTVTYNTGQDKFYESEFATVADTASIDSRLFPLPGDTLLVSPVGETPRAYALDALMSDNGRLARFILVPA